MVLATTDIDLISTSKWAIGRQYIQQFLLAHVIFEGVRSFALRASKSVILTAFTDSERTFKAALRLLRVIITDTTLELT